MTMTITFTLDQFLLKWKGLGVLNSSLRPAWEAEGTVKVRMLR
jgi:hypothetical protein